MSLPTLGIVGYSIPLKNSAGFDARPRNRSKSAPVGARNSNDHDPDATFTLRLAYGRVKGYEEGGQQIPAHTTFAGLYERAAEHENRPPFDLPKIWADSQSNVDLATPFNFVSTADITGGNSGSPVVDRNGEFVGLIFDSNIQGLVIDYAYTDVQARATSVDARGIVEALQKVYRADDLVKELFTGKRGAPESKQSSAGQ